ncbi:MAG: response regulator [Lachnospiraceae bacterium]|nr:response regulator [Lachnospiraceae bacterium]
MRVIIADDEPITRMDLKEMLENEGHQVVGEAADGFDAVEICRSEQPDLVIMDVKMPLMDGLTASQIVNEEQLADAVVLLTAYSDREFIEEAKKSGVSSYLVKPVDERSFIPALEIALERGREMKKLKKDYNTISQRLENRTSIEQAKGVLMSRRGMTEQDAYDYIRKISRTKNVSMKRVADIILMHRGD